MFAAASSFFARTNISQNYNYGSSGVGGSGSRTSTPGPSGSSNANSPAPGIHAPPTQIGLWKVTPATHKVTGKRVSVWSFDKRTPEVERLNAPAKERVLEVLKAEAGALGRLRHPSILEMVEPLEETRSELVFATELLLSSLQMSMPNGTRQKPIVDLDEVEIQKGVLQLCKGLAFLHTSAKLVHSNLCPESIVINSSGDWKISGLGLTIALASADGKPTRWEFPSYDGRAPSYIQRSFDYMAPEYALDEQINTASDMYALGCILYAVHMKGSPPFKTHGSLGAIRDNAGRPPPDIGNLDTDLQVLLKSLITRHPANRPSPTSIPTHSFFSSLPISTLNFLDRATFSTKSREEKISFMKGLTNVLDRFSPSLRSRKILPSLLEEMKDTYLLPHILPNVFAIASILSSLAFAAQVLPSLKPLFVIKDPPQNMLTLLDNLHLLQEKTEKSVFRQEVLPLVYNALDSDHAIVQERALRCVPELCETIDYAEVQSVLFPRVALVFTKTRILSVKIATLETFLVLVKTLDQASLTQKLVPLLSKIRTKEPGVMMATLSVQEAMGVKVDREAVATLVLPQLWGMSIGPLLNLEQFQKFMSVIRKLGERVEKEHNQYLRDSQRIEDRSTGKTNGLAEFPAASGPADFESLVGRSNNAGGSTETPNNAPSWEDDVWGSIFTNGAESSGVRTPAVASPPMSPSLGMQSIQPLPSLPQPSTSDAFQPSRPAKLGAKSIPASSFSSAPFPPAPSSQPSFGTMSSPMTASMQPMSTQHNNSALPPSKPNYNISLPPTMAPMNASSPPPLQNYSLNSNSIGGMSSPMAPAMASPPLFASPPAMGSLLAPSKPAQPSWNAGKKPSSADWGDFDPLA